MHLRQRIPRTGNDRLICILANDKAVPRRCRIRFGQREEKHVAEFIAQFCPLASDAVLRLCSPRHVRNVQRWRPCSIPPVVLALIWAALGATPLHHCGLKSLEASPIGREWPLSPNTLERKQGVLASGWIAVVQEPCLHASFDTECSPSLIALHRELSASGYGRVAETLSRSSFSQNALFVLPLP